MWFFIAFAILHITLLAVVLTRGDLIPIYLEEVVENDARYYDENKLLAIDYFSKQ